MVEHLAVTLKVESSNLSKGKTFFINEKKKTENMMMVAPSSGQSSHGLAIYYNSDFFQVTLRHECALEKYPKCARSL